jgi:hypothetical protein
MPWFDMRWRDEMPPLTSGVDCGAKCAICKDPVEKDPHNSVYVIDEQSIGRGKFVWRCGTCREMTTNWKYLLPPDR